MISLLPVSLRAIFRPGKQASMDVLGPFSPPHSHKWVFWKAAPPFFLHATGHCNALCFHTTMPAIIPRTSWFRSSSCSATTEVYLQGYLQLSKKKKEFFTSSTIFPPTSMTAWINTNSWAIDDLKEYFIYFPKEKHTIHIWWKVTYINSAYLPLKALLLCGWHSTLNFPYFHTQY